MRVQISLSEFKDNDFSCLGLPKLYIKICQFLTQYSFDDVVNLKTENLFSE
jgi:hypothetical protein